MYHSGFREFQLRYLLQSVHLLYIKEERKKKRGKILRTQWYEVLRTQAWSSRGAVMSIAVEGAGGLLSDSWSPLMAAYEADTKVLQH